MTYAETTDYLFSALPMYQRIGASAYKANLDNTIKLLAELNNPETKFKSIHVAGTNGKGSTSHMLASIFQTAGYKTGLYTSPHLKDFRERIKIDGVCIPEQNVVDFVEKNRGLFDDIKPSFFEMTVALAFDHFAKEQVDIAIIEVGMGGRLDSTNAITPLLSVITNIGLDHTQFLGDTLEKIAAEKAGIIKPKIPVIIGETNEKTAPVFLEIAKQNHSEIVFADQHFVETHGCASLHADCDLQGIYQKKNIKTALSAIFSIKNQFKNLSENAIQEGLANVVKNTGLMGRWQIIGEKPLIVCDTGHNEDGIKQILQQIEQTPHHRLHAVFGVVNDKDVTTILLLLPKHATYYFCKANLPRALSETDLQEQAQKFGLQGDAFSTVREALETAKKSAHPNDLIWVGGSTFVVADVL
ncbi:MAG: bifunctional folylpolyglutamate synthase/dihydrofolate synthase [Bacteroidales bacterium]|jgi:dihydrofolate synthase/folylpolyglutamate synthase|nr:bifunctional folylpolyglutamate synthase/dihydrofolate synthase [Bacteroidales bacterium]